MYQTILQIKCAWTKVQLPYTQAVPLDGNISKILPARGTRQRKFEFGDPPNQELNKNIRPQGKTYLKTLVPKSQTSAVLAYKFTVYELDGKRPKEIHSICQTIHCFTLYALFLTCQVNKNVLVLLTNIVYH